MAKLAPLRSSFRYWLLLALLPGCQGNRQKLIAIPARYVSTDVPGWQQRAGTLWLNDSLFSGWQFQTSPTGDTLFCGSFLNGKAEGVHRQWYASGQLKEERRYRTGWQEGEQRGWHESGKRAFICQFKNDVYEGTRTEWYANGKPALAGHYHEGQETGLQRQWFDTGTLKVNYEVRNGRHYGFTGVKNCVNVWDSITVTH
ncbi:toxin-antitoxin system YwqK family antitoxin [Fibrella arboris]|uniref:toxin-antitoxin system YwqK family antitoxin n=1 Tax=Fibrella arboris TaxID=3242486 RepID=UPI003522BDFB